LENIISFEDLELLYEDQDLLAVNKPESLASIHDSAGEVVDLQTILIEHYKSKIFVVHRLDKEVSGVILFAKNEKTHKILNMQFAEHTVKKSYAALVHGMVEKDEGEIRFPIREFGSGRMGIDKAKGKPSKTFYNVKEKLFPFTLVDLSPTTGRRHQLRVHLYAIGHPIVGDVRYGEKEMQEKFPRLMLHAKSVLFTKPDKKEIKIEAPPASPFTKYLNELRNNSK
jgi:tRNA pseudouridine32 synthase / 23S rRNA pseudouridine746 synthase